MENKNYIQSEINDEKLLLNQMLKDLKSEVKKVQNKIKEKQKPKTITISSHVHTKIKRHCNLFGYNIGEWIENLALTELNNNFCFTKDDRDSKEFYEEESQKLIDSWLLEKDRSKKLVKTNCLLIDKLFKFSGYSLIDNNPIYEFYGDQKELDEYENVIFTHAKEGEISKNIKYNPNIDIIIDSKNIGIFELNKP